MQFNDTTSNSGLIQECETITNLGDTGISGDATILKEFTRRINAAYYEIVSMILESHRSWDFDDKAHTTKPVATTSLVADQSDYSLPSEALKVKRVEVTYDGTNWYRATLFDVNEMSDPTDSTHLTANFTTSKPYYDLQQNQIILYPTPSANSTNGLKAWFVREIDQFTTADTSQEPGIDEPWHIMIALKASYMWLRDNHDFNKAEAIKRDLNEMELRLRMYYSTKDQDNNLAFNGAYIDYN